MSQIITKLLNDPYRILFPTGLIYLIISVGIWFPIAFLDSNDYPIFLHQFLMINGFIFSYIGGFLMTAIPKFSQSLPTKKLEIIIFLTLPLLGISDALKESSNIYLITVLQSLFLIQFIIIRIAKRKQNPPSTFIFIPLSLLLIFIMSLLALKESIFFSTGAYFLCPISLLIIGIGSRLIPAILGHREIVMAQKQVYEKKVSLTKIVPAKFLIIGIIFISTFFKEHWSADFVQFQIVAYFATTYFKIFEKPKILSALTWSLYFTNWIFLLGFLLKLIWPDGDTHGLHWIFIGSFLSYIILISTRVTISHSGKSSSLENSSIIYWITGLIFIAMTTRVTAFIMEDLFEGHLGYSALLVTIAIGLWLLKFGKYLFIFPKPN